MSHLLLIPLLLPLTLAALVLALPLSARMQKIIGLAGALGFLIAALGLLLQSAQGDIAVTLLGDWPAPYGIVLLCDRLSALMLTLTGLLATAALLYATGGSDVSGRHFHALFQFQLFGLAGAFLTGDLFNLFVFFEVLLMASYGLLLQGGGAARTRAALHYALLNLIGSLLFLLGAAMLYAATGTLNMAHLAMRLQGLASADASLASAGGLLLLTVFALKAALLPLHAWMVPAYAAAAAPVAALFAILTKVGVYAMLRLLVLLSGIGPDQSIMPPVGLVLTGAAILTVAAGSLGVLASLRLRPMIAYLVMVSVGTLLAGIAPGSANGVSAALYYLIHTTLITAGLFLLADLIARGRPQGQRLIIGDPPRAAAILSPLFLLGAIAIAGLPPLSGFLGKTLILSAVRDAAMANGSPAWAWVWAAVLVSSLLVVLGLSRAGVLLLWRSRGATATPGAAESAPAGDARRLGLAASIALLAASPLLILFAAPLTAFTLATATQVLDNRAYVDAIPGLEAMTLTPSASAEGQR